MISDFGTEMEKVFVNRSVELARLHTALKEASGGNTQVILIEGETGIGKTSLVERFLRDIESKKYSIKKSVCKAGVSTPYAPIKDIVGESEMKKKMASGAPLLGLVSSSQSKHPEELKGEREKIFKDFVETVRKQSLKKPVIVFIDAVQWMDEATAKLFNASVDKMVGGKILLILTYRPVDVRKKGHVSTMLSRLKEKDMCASISLKRLGYEETAEAIKQMLKRDDIPSSFINTVYKQTEGNPLFIKELISSLIQEGILDPTSYKKIHPGDIRIPPSMKEVLMRRVSKLSPQAKKVLTYASVIGPRFSFDILHNISGMDEEGLLDLLDELLEAGVIEEDGTTEDEVYTFTYIQIRDIIEESLSKSRKRVVHKKIAEYLEKSGGGGGEPYDLANHFFMGGVYEKAYEYAVAAAEKSATAFGFESAIYYYNMAVEAAGKIKKVSDEDLLDIYVKLGDLHRALGEWDTGVKEYKKALKIAEKLNDRVAIAEINLGIGSIEKNRGGWNTAEICFEAARKVGEELEDIQILGDAERGLGYIHWRKSEYKDAVTHYTSSIKYAKESEDSGMAGKVFVEMGNVYSDMGSLDKAIEYYKKSIPRLKQIKKYDEIARVLNNLGDSYLQKGEWDKAIEYFKRCEDAAAGIGELNLIAWAMFNGAEAYARKGETEKAREMCEESLDALEAMEDRIGLASAYRVCGIISIAEEDYIDAIKHLQKSVKMLKDLQTWHLLGLSELELARAFAGKGDVKHAKKWYEESLSIFKKIGVSKYVDVIEKELSELS